MGQAKIRKKNGTYPTREQIAQMEEERIRWNTKVWFPTAHDLPLLHVPENVRPLVRKRIDPWLHSMVHCLSIQDDSFDERLGIRGGDCWAVAQSFVMAAKDQNVTLVEGVWTRPDELEEGQRPAPHTWAMVDGYRIDLVGEFYCWRGDCDWLYEPLAEYTYADLSKLFGMGPDEDGLVAEGFDISEIFWWKQHGDDESFLPEHLRSEHEPNPKDFGQPNGNFETNRLEFETWLKSESHDRWNQMFDAWQNERNDFVNSIVFKPAIDRMNARLTPSLRKAA